MDRFRIPRKGGMGDDVLDLRPIYDAIAELQQQVAALTQGGTGASAKDEAYVPSAAAEVAAHEAAADPHPQYLLSVSFTWTNLGGKPTTLAGFGITDAAALIHTHAISDVTGLQTAIDGKAAVSHSHSISNVTGLQDALDAKLASASFTWANIGGKPTSPQNAGFTSGRLDTFYESRGALSGFQLFDRTNTTRSWVWYADAAVFYLYSGQLAANVLSISESAGSLGLLRSGSEFNRAAANSGTLTRQPRIFVGGSDPGAAMADGDLWIT